jgi:hypothetical protein
VICMSPFPAKERTSVMGSIGCESHCYNSKSGEKAICVLDIEMEYSNYTRREQEERSDNKSGEATAPPSRQPPVDTHTPPPPAAASPTLLLMSIPAALQVRCPKGNDTPLPPPLPHPRGSLLNLLSPRPAAACWPTP